MADVADVLRRVRKEKEQEDATSVVATVLYIPLSVAFALLNAWAFLMFWSWLAVPIFHAPHLDYPHAFGVAVFFGYLKRTSCSCKRTGVEMIADAVAFSFSLYLGLLMVWLVLHFHG